MSPRQPAQKFFAAFLKTEGLACLQDVKDDSEVILDECNVDLQVQADRVASILPLEHCAHLIDGARSWSVKQVKRKPLFQ